MSPTTYHAVRVTYDSARDFDETRARFDELVPLLDPAVTIDLVVRGASWADVERAVDTRTGPLGLVAIARIDQGALLTLSGHPLDATLYLVGNPLIARRLIELDSAAALYAPFRVVVFRDDAGVHIAYDKPSTVLASLGSTSIDQIARDLDDKIAAAAERAASA